MKPDYYTKSHTRTHVYHDAKGKKHKRVRTTGEHVMTHRVFAGLSVHKVLTMLGGARKR